MINETHDKDLQSWVESANTAETEFPIQNLPFCLFAHGSGPKRPGVAIGSKILDLQGSAELLPCLGDFNKIGRSLRRLEHLADVNLSQLRHDLISILRAGANAETKENVSEWLVDASSAEFFVPFDVGDYTDFYCSIYHATNVGRLFRPDNPLLPNYKWIPIGYHGRASSLVISGTDFHRPKGQNHSDPEAPPVYIPSKALDYEMEVGFFVKYGNRLGETIDISNAEEHIFGLCLVNDWSARDIQGWEYQPLGPFLAKSFATSVSPFVVTMEALAPFRTASFDRDDGDPQPLDYLSSADDRENGGIDMTLEVFIASKQMREEGIEPMQLSSSNLSDLYWTLGQMLTHHASNGCNLATGDLLASGTVSGAEDSARGCLLEITRRGADPVELPTGETRKFLQDHDDVIMKGYCERDGFRRIGLGTCVGRVLPANQ